MGGELRPFLFAFGMLYLQKTRHRRDDYGKKAGGH